MSIDIKLRKNYYTYCDAVPDQEVESISFCFQLVPLLRQVNIGVGQQPGKYRDERKHTLRAVFTVRLIFCVCSEKQEK